MLKIKQKSTTDLSKLKKDLESVPLIKSTYFIPENLFHKFKMKSLIEKKSMTSILKELVEGYVK